MSNIIDKIQVSGITYDIGGSGGTETIELTQAQYDALVDKDPNVFYIITDAQAGDLTNYYTKTETNTLLGGKADTATTYTKDEVDNAITAATSTKQDTLVSGTNIKTINNTSLLGSGNIDIQGGGGKAIEAGRGISITTGETADTVSFNLPISAGTGTNSIVEGDNTTASGMYGSHAEGYHTNAVGWGAHAEGNSTTASGNYSHTEGGGTTASGIQSHAEGDHTTANNLAEHASGRYNVSNKANTTFGDSGNTLFSVGNGTGLNARHNAFEIRQNGDIYLSSGGTDIKLQDHLGGGGGGKAIEGGRGISITTGATADTVSFNLPIYSGTGEGSIIGGFSGNTASGKYSIALGGRYESIFDYQYCKASGKGAISFGGTASGQGAFSCGENPQALGFASVAFGDSTKAIGVESFVIGRNTTANTFVSFAQGKYTKTTNEAEVALGEFNNSVSGSSTFGNSGNTLFSVGNGTADNARHNAFEIRQNGDIYITLNGQDVKLQDQLGGGGASYSAGTGIDITNNVISVSGVVETSAITTNITSSSTDAQVPSAKAVYDIVGDIETLLSQI